MSFEEEFLRDLIAAFNEASGDKETFEDMIDGKGKEDAFKMARLFLNKGWKK